MNYDVFHTAPDTTVGPIAIIYNYFTGGVFADFSFVLFSPTAGQTVNDMIAASKTSQAAYAALHSYTVTNEQIWALQADWSQGTSGSLDFIKNKPGNATTSVAGFMSATDKTKLDGLSVPTVTKKLFKASTAGGAGVVTFFTDTNGDGTGTALYASLTADDLMFAIDGVADQHAFISPTVAGNKKSVTVTLQRQNFSSGNVLLNLLGALTNVLTGVTYVNAPNGIAVKMLVGIDD